MISPTMTLVRSVTGRAQRSTTCITVTGEIDLATSADLTAAVTWALRGGPALGMLLFNPAVSFLDCAGVAELFGLLG